MGLTIFSSRGGSSSNAEDFKHKVKAAKRLIEEICEDVEEMENKYSDEFSERDGYRERSRYRDDFSERRRY